MKIGELAERTGLTPSRIRFYERIGLLTLVAREANGYRSYPQEAVTVLDLITAAQKADFSLDEIRMLIPAGLAQWPCMRCWTRCTARCGTSRHWRRGWRAARRRSCR